MFRPRRSSLVVTALVGMSVASPLILASPALAVPAQRISKCTGQDKTYVKRVYDLSKNFAPTNSYTEDISAGEDFHHKVTLKRGTRLVAKSNFSVEVGLSAGWEFASVSTQIKASVAKENVKSSSKTITTEANYSAKNYPRRVVFFDGYTLVTGRWHYFACSREPGVGVDKYGSVQSWYHYEEGTALCPASNYRKGTPANVADRAGC